MGYGHDIAHINKMWFVLIFAGVVFFSLMTTIHAGIEQITQDHEAIQAQMNAVMNESR